MVATASFVDPDAESTRLEESASLFSDDDPAPPSYIAAADVDDFDFEQSSLQPSSSSIADVDYFEQSSIQPSSSSIADVDYFEQSSLQRDPAPPSYIADVDNFEEPSLQDPDPALELSSSLKLTYEIVRQSTKRGRPKLIDSQGYTYNIQRLRGVVTDWQCSVRRKSTLAELQLNSAAMTSCVVITSTTTRHKRGR
ncbi:hypothetical protein OS493_001024 [Desmophyllum pertusum]|uniref:Uncharacterized protein n=1 Tax=Desmophyllum pertusum TaxID=174260 RepID=A0A9W9ZX92_9CNID|nr:hypothetical protein OS493_001024 [Desmophyllum pertusum]